MNRDWISAALDLSHHAVFVAPPRRGPGEDAVRRRPALRELQREWQLAALEGDLEERVLALLQPLLRATRRYADDASQ